MMHFIKEGSLMADKIRVGDLLVAVDDDNIRAMTAVKARRRTTRRGSSRSSAKREGLGVLARLANGLPVANP
jgi:hypothetical protein